MRLHQRFLESDKKKKCLRVYPGIKGSIIVKNLGEGTIGQASYINEMTLPFPSYNFMVNHLLDMMPEGFFKPEGSERDLLELIITIWDKEKDLLHITFDPDYSMTWEYANGAVTTHSPWYWLYSEEKHITERINNGLIHKPKDKNGRDSKGGKYN